MNAQESKDAKSTQQPSFDVVDGRTGQTKSIPITHGRAIAASALKTIKQKGQPGLVSYDPGYTNTAVCQSKICDIKGSKGELSYRGYDIIELVNNSTFIEVAYLLIYGKLPDKDQLSLWTTNIMRHSSVHQNLLTLMGNFRYDAHPMGMLSASVSAMGTFYPEANPALQGSDLFQRDISLRNRQIFRILGKLPTIAANSYRHRIGRAYNQPTYPRDPTPLSYTENFLYMLDHLSEKTFKPHPVFVKALDKIWILHAEHSLNCSTATMRQLASTLVDPYSCVAGASAALYGPLHGGANEAVLRMLERIGSVENIPKFIEEVKAKKTKLFGFGHRIYKNYDPRAKILKDIAYEVFEVTGKSPLLDVALELERIALNDQYFIERKLYPNVDFYSGLIYKQMGFPTDMFPVLFSIPRAAGWLAHWCESLDDKETKIYRPKQLYTGVKPGQKYVPVEKRPKESENPQKYEHSAFFRRRELGTRSKL